MNTIIKTGNRYNCNGREAVEYHHRCGYEWLEWEDADEYPNYCPNCGELAEVYVECAEGYEVVPVFANKTDGGCYGDIFNSREEAVKAYPNAEILMGYCVVKIGEGLVPDGCNDWNDTFHEAITDFMAHITKGE